MSKRKASKMKRAGRLLKKVAPNCYRVRAGMSGKTHLPYGYIEFGKKKGD